MNAKVEFLFHTSNRSIKCAELKRFDEDKQERNTYILQVGFSDDDFNIFLESINFEYYEGLGGQELFGFIWYNDGTWSSRFEYDGSEWWEYNSLPEIPKYLIAGYRGIAQY